MVTSWGRRARAVLDSRPSHPCGHHATQVASGASAPERSSHGSPRDRRATGRPRQRTRVAPRAWARVERPWMRSCVVSCCTPGVPRSRKPLSPSRERGGSGLGLVRSVPETGESPHPGPSGEVTGAPEARLSRIGDGEDNAPRRATAVRRSGSGVVKRPSPRNPRRERKLRRGFREPTRHECSQQEARVAEVGRTHLRSCASDPVARRFRFARSSPEEGALPLTRQGGRDRAKGCAQLERDPHRTCTRHDPRGEGPEENRHDGRRPGAFARPPLTGGPRGDPGRAGQPVSHAARRTARQLRDGWSRRSVPAPATRDVRGRRRTGERSSSRDKARGVGIRGAARCLRRVRRSRSRPKLAPANSNAT